MILGIDPGLANVGWAVLKDENCLVDRGCINTKIEDEREDRYKIIYKEIERLIKIYKIKEIAVEGLFFSKNVKSAIKVAEVTGVIKICGVLNKVKVFEYNPVQVKMALVGYGKAEKSQVELMVKNCLGLKEDIKPSHVSDAVAIGLTHLFKTKFSFEKGVE